MEEWTENEDQVLKDIEECGGSLSCNLCLNFDNCRKGTKFEEVEYEGY